MSDQDVPKEEIEEQLAPYVIEGARSSRSKCKTCRKKIDMGALRIGILIEGPYGTGYMWHHLKCAAKRQFDRVEEAFELEAWKEAKTPPEGVPGIEDLRGLAEKAAEERQKKKEVPHTEPAPSGRSKCKHCNELIAQDSMRVVVGRDVEFGRQVRTSPINVHPKCVAAELLAPDCGTESEGFADALRANSQGVSPERIEEALAEIGSLPS
jgi:hypothetical protein